MNKYNVQRINACSYGLTMANEPVPQGKTVSQHARVLLHKAYIEIACSNKHLGYIELFIALENVDSVAVAAS